MKKKNSIIAIGRLSGLLMLGGLAFSSLPGFLVHAQEDCRTVRIEAQDLYKVGRNTEVIELLNQCLPDRIPQADKVGAYKILALAFIAEDFHENAKIQIEKLLDLDENFKPDEQDNTEFIDFVKKAQKNRSQKKGLKKRWFIIGGTTIVAGIVTALVANREGSTPKRLTDPPPFLGDK